MKKLIHFLFNRETLTYLLFGGMTTLVDFVVFKVFDLFFGGRWYLLSNTIAWIIEQGGLWCFVELLHFDEKVFDFKLLQLGGKIMAKIIIGVVVVILNYLLSKFVIFKKKHQSEEEA